MKNKQYGLVGKSLTHSYSKWIHEQLSPITYDLLPMKEANLISLLKGKKFCGLNITIPYKEIVIPYLDEIDFLAKKIGAINTIVHRNGKLYGYNTDYLGFQLLLNVKKIPILNQKILILGSGGSSKMVQCVLNDLQAKTIHVVSRFEGFNFTYDTLNNDAQYDVIVNTTPVGMHPNQEDPFLINLDLFQSVHTVIDLIYNPSKTKLLLEAQKRKKQIENGLLMLVAQAFYANEYFFQYTLPKPLILELYQKIYFKNLNLTFIGLSGSGKTTISKSLAKEFSKIYLSIDEEIINKTKMNIYEVFQTFGEPYFRQLEKELIEQISKQNNTIIDCGGGMILESKNIDYLKQNGMIIYIHRNIDFITIDDQRPLVKNRLDLKRLYEQRHSLYLQYADLVLENNGTVEDLIDRLKEKLNESFNY